MTNHKISAEFEARLNRLPPNEPVRVVLLLNMSGQPGKTSRQSPEERKASIQAIRQKTEDALHKIDEILDNFRGKRLAEQINALGTIPVEVTVDGINALSQSEYVKAILEDQPLTYSFNPNILSVG